MSYVTTVYIMGGPHDGETFACGPFSTEDEAQSAADDLMGLGATFTHYLHAGAEAVIAEL